MSAKGTLGFILGSIVGADAGATAGLLLSPRTGAERRAMAAAAPNGACGSAVDAYERGSRVVSDKISNVRPSVDATPDELRAKVDLARERMDQLRSSLSDAVNTTSAQVQDAVNTVAEKVGAEDDRPAEQEAQSVQVEVVDVSEPTDLEDEAKNSQ